MQANEETKECEATPQVIEETPIEETKQEEHKQSAQQDLISKLCGNSICAGELKKSIEMGEPTEMIAELLQDLASKIMVD